MKKIFNTLLTVFIFMLSFNVFLKANTQEAYNIITNPSYDMSTSMHISYHSDIEGSFVEYTKASDEDYSNSKVVIGTHRKWSRDAVEVIDETRDIVWNTEGFYERNVYDVELTDLEPNTKYKYRVGKDSFSEDYFFTTAGSGDFSFAFLTDPQFGNKEDSEIFNNLINKLLEIDPDLSFTLFSGDVIDRGGKSQQWDWFFEKDSLRKLPFVMTVGNHEYYDASTSPIMTNNDFFKAHTFNPQNGLEEVMNSSYYFKYANTLFISIDTEYRGSLDQTKWFDEIMEKEQAQFVVVFMHRSSYGSKYASHSVAVRNQWQKIFEKHQVDLVLSGHDHVYARSHLLYKDQITENHYEGITYIIGGSAGAKFYDASGDNAEYYAKTIENTTVGSVISVTDEKMSLKVYNLNGEVLDEVEILSKRPTEIEPNFNKTEFMNAISLTKDEFNDELLLTYPEAYGHVEHIYLVDHNETVYHHDPVPTNQPKREKITLEANRFYNMTLRVIFVDGSSEEIDYFFTTKVPFGEFRDVEVVDITNNSALLKWDYELIDDQIRRLEVYLNDQRELSILIRRDEKVAKLENLDPLTEYTVSLRALDGYGDVLYINDITFMTTADKAIVDNILVSNIKENEAKLTWNYLSTDYETVKIFLNNQEVAKFSSSENIKKFILNDLSKETEYEVKIQIFDQTGKLIDQTITSFNTSDTNLKKGFNPLYIVIPLVIIAGAGIVFLFKGKKLKKE